MTPLSRGTRFASRRLRRVRRRSRLLLSALRPGGRRVYLTFDDGPTADLPQVLDVLARYRAKATFFIVGEKVTLVTLPSLVRAIKEGHAVGSHSWSHADFARSEPEQIVAEIKQADEVLSWVFTTANLDAASRPRLFRFPYLRTGTGERRRTAQALLRKLGYHAHDCDVDPNDWELPLETVTLDEVERRVLSAGAGDTVLLHETPYTVQVLERILPELAGRYELCSLVRGPKPLAARRSTNDDSRDGGRSQYPSGHAG